MKRRVLLLIAALLLALPALAHDPMLSGIRVIVGEGKTVVSAMTHVSQLTISEGRKTLSPAEIDLAFRRRVRLRFAGRDFAPGKTNVLRDDPNDLVTWQATVEGEAADPEVLARLYPDDPSSRLVVSVVREGVVTQETLLDAAHPSLTDAPPESKLAIALRYVREGVLHIFGGPDHICFVLGLLLLGGSLKELLKTVTAFTLAHSITLTIAALGVWNPSPRYVEPLIALSIVMVAAENLRKSKRADLRPWLALVFGLIHGFGFAGALAEVGLPRQALGVALLSFNVGVEIGQASVVLTVAPGLAWLARARPKIHARVVTLGSVAIGLAGAFWLVTRIAR